MDIIPQSCLREWPEFPVAVQLSGIDWVIVGGEFGPGAHEMKKEWVVEIRDKCIKENVKFFLKQWGGTRKSKTGRKLDGRIYDEMPG